MRIRTIKPEFFTHEELYDAESLTGLPLRLAFAGLWCASDREGRFAWKPRTLKLGILPYDDVDFALVLDALEAAGFIARYSVDGKEYGEIPSWHEHQHINNRESESRIPENPRETDASSTREPRVVHASLTRLVHARGEGKGREGKGKERIYDCHFSGEPAAEAEPEKVTSSTSELESIPESTPEATPEPDLPLGSKQDPTPYRDIVRVFNEIVSQRNVTWPAVQKKTSGRLTAMRARWRSEGKSLDYFRDLFSRAADSDFVSGRNGKWTSCNFDWLLKPANAAKVLEGSYDDQSKATTYRS